MVAIKKSVLFALVVFFALGILCNSILVQCIASEDGEVYIQMNSGSMFPTLLTGDLLKVEENLNVSEIYAAPLNTSGGQSGDILVSHCPGSEELIAHRAVEKVELGGEVYFVTQGDHNLVPGPCSPTPASSIIGKVLAFRRDFNVGTWNNTSYHIFVETNSSFLCSVPDPKSVLPNITYYNFSFNESLRTVEFDISGYISNATAGFCNVTIPKNLLRCDSLNDWQVKLNETSTDYLAVENETHTFVYFSYDQPVYTVTITGKTGIPEYPSFIVLPLLMTAILLTIIVYKRRHLTRAL